MKIRIYCEQCNKGLLGEPSRDNYGERVVNFMVKHSEDYKPLAAHKGLDGADIKPHFLCEKRKS